jgi:hypothetical protein
MKEQETNPTDMKMVQKGRYDHIGSYCEGRAKVYQDGLVGYIDTDGKVVIPIAWEDASDFSEGLAYVADAESGMYGFIDKDGRVVVPFVWFGARPFKNGRAEVADEDFNWYYIDKEGNILR